MPIFHRNGASFDVKNRVFCYNKLEILEALYPIRAAQPQIGIGFSPDCGFAGTAVCFRQVEARMGRAVGPFAVYAFSRIGRSRRAASHLGSCRVRRGSGCRRADTARIARIAAHA